MDGSGDDEEFLVVALQLGKGALAEIAAVGLLAVDQEHRRLNLSGHI